MDTIEGIDRVEAAGGYVNFFVKRDTYIQTVLDRVFDEGETYGSGQTGAGHTFLIEHTSINPNASPHMGRARNALIGDALVRLFRFEGYQTDVHYFVNDIGLQIAMLVLAGGERDNVPFDEMLQLYADIYARMTDDPSIKAQAIALLARLEAGDADVQAAFGRIVDRCMAGQTAIFHRLGIAYDQFDKESRFLWDGSMTAIVAQLQQMDQFIKDEHGRHVVNLTSQDLPPLVITRQDGTSLYPLRDIAYTMYKSRQHAHRNLIVLGEDQKLYFQQVKAVVEMLGASAPEVVHYAFVHLTDGKMSSRQGTVVLLEDVMAEAVERIRAEMIQLDRVYDEVQLERIAYGSIRYSMLKVAHDRSVTFDWDTVLSFDGDSALYLLYTMVRIQSLLRKGVDIHGINIHGALLHNEEEYQLVKTVGRFPDVMAQAVGDRSPSIVLKYAYQLAKQFSAYYAHCAILDPDETIQSARLQLAWSVDRVLQNALSIAGIEPVDAL